MMLQHGMIAALGMKLGLYINLQFAPAVDAEAEPTLAIRQLEGRWAPPSHARWQHTIQRQRVVSEWSIMVKGTGYIGHYSVFIGGLVSKNGHGHNRLSMVDGLQHPDIGVLPGVLISKCSLCDLALQDS